LASGRGGPTARRPRFAVATAGLTFSAAAHRLTTVVGAARSGLERALPPPTPNSPTRASILLRATVHIRVIEGSFDLIIAPKFSSTSMIRVHCLGDARQLAPSRRASLRDDTNGYGLKRDRCTRQRWLRQRLGFERPLAALRDILVAMEWPTREILTHPSNREHGHVHSSRAERCPGC